MKTTKTESMLMKTLRRVLPVIAGCAGLCAALRADQTLVPTGSQWRYLDNGTDPGTAWRGAGFDDSGWAYGAAQLGYGDGDEATVVGFGPNSSAKYITTYFRKTFAVTDPGAFTGLNLRVLRDDGVVVYLNGVEVYRNNLPTGTITSATLAPTAISGAEESTTFLTASLPAGTLVAGPNLVAVEIHQQSGTSSDISFDLELTGVTPGQPSVVRGPYLQNATPGSMTVQWRTSAATDGLVRYGTSPGNLTQTVTGAASATDHVVTLTGLAPNTLYYYAAGNAAGDLVSGSDHFFYTPPVAGTVQPVRIWVLGDAGTGSAGQVAVRNAYTGATGSRYTDLILLLGDNAYNNGTDAEYQSYFFNVYPAAFRTTPSFSTIGNHDTASLSNPDINTTPYFRIFTHPTAAEGGGVASGTEKYYSFNYANIHFVCLDSMTSSRTVGSAMLNWLEADLQQSTADWLVAYFHHPPYTKGSHDSDSTTDSSGRMIDMRANVLPILESHGVDLVLAGHSHSYERSYLLDGHYGLSSTLTESMKVDGGDGREAGTGAYTKTGGGPVANAGAVYVVPGSAGQISGGTLNHPAMFVSLNVLGSLVLDVNGNRLDGTFLTSTGATNDTFTILKSGPAVNQPPTVALTSPADGSSVEEGLDIVLAASASDADGSVASVAFYADGVLLGTDSGAPYGWTWTGASQGSHQLTAVATDNAGAQTTSVGVTVTVTAPPAEVTTLAAGEQAVLGTVTGTYLLTQAADGSSQLVREVESGGKVTQRYSQLEHRWRFDGVRGGLAVTVLATVSADASPDGDSFQFEWSGNGGTSWSPLFLVASGAPAGSSHVGVLPATSRGTVWVRVRDTNRTAGARALDTVRVDRLVIRTELDPNDTPPAAPTGLLAGASSSTSVQLSWADNSDNESGFVLERSADGVQFAALATVASGVTTFLDTTVLPAGTYVYRVRAFTASYDSGWAVSGPVTTPDGLALGLVGTKQKGIAVVDLTWTGGMSVPTVTVWRSVNGGAFQAIATNVANAGGGTYRDNTGIKGAATLVYRVCGSGGAPCSNDATVVF